MTVKLLADRYIDSKNYKAGELCDTDDFTEVGLIAAKLAVADLTGGITHVEPIAQPQYVPVLANINGVTGGIELSAGGVTSYILQNYTWATLPTASSVSGMQARVTDLNNAVFESNGTRWKPVNGRAVIASVDAATSMSGITETIVFQKLIPANVIKNSDRLCIKCTFSKSGVSESTTFTVRVGKLGTIADTSLQSAIILSTTTVSAGIYDDFKRISATSLQKMGNGSQSTQYNGGSTAAVPTAVTVANLDSNPVYLTITFTQSAAAETATLHDLVLELVSSQA